MPSGWSKPPAWPDLIQQQIDIKRFYDLSQYNQCDAKIKIAIYEVDWALRSDGVDQSIRESRNILNLSRGSDWIFVIESEPHSNYLIRLSLKNVTWVTSGVIRRVERQSASWQYHIWRIAELYHSIPEVLEDLRPQQPKSKFFDALLGTPKLHRKFIWDQINQRGLSSKTVMTMAGKKSSECIIEPGMQVVDQQQNNIHTVTVSYHGHLIHVPCLVPVDIYNSTAYSIVAETDHDNDALIVTEKVTKPMLARRLFVAFTGRGYLQYLRKIGFRTFGEVIDEGYDLIEDNHARWSAAMDQVEKLCNKDQRSILDKIKPIVDHNYDLIMNSDYFVKSAVDVLVSKINSIVKAKDDSCRTSM